VEVDGGYTGCVEERLREESSVGKQKQDVDGIVDQSLCQYLSRGLCAIKHGD
jgi:hypothetical protein